MMTVEQLEVVNADKGMWVVLASPGSGKTFCIVERFKRLMMSGVAPSEILSLTFTNEAAQEMSKRSGVIDNKSFRTFHSFCLNLLQAERKEVPFQMVDTIIPVENQNYELFFRLCKTYPRIRNFRDLQSRISLWKQTGVSPKQALEESCDVDYFMALAYKDYERISREEGWLDFDDLILETVRLLQNNEAVQKRHQYKYIMVDEAQDMDYNQEFLVHLISSEYKNILLIGDENQCQPGGTRVKVLREKATIKTKARIKSVRIRDLKIGDVVLTWRRRCRTVRNFGKRIRAISKRHYCGPMLTLFCGDKKTSVTPDHQLWVRFNETARKTRIIYLMWRKDFGFRVGQCELFNRKGFFNFGQRLYHEKADKVWILKVVKDKCEAIYNERMIQAKYGVPTSVYEPVLHYADNYIPWGRYNIRDLFSITSKNSMGFWLLKDLGLDFHSPLFEGMKTHMNKNGGYIKIPARNVVSKIMNIASTRKECGEKIEKIVKRNYWGYVFSLDVEKDHTYIADGIPVGNCIYAWRGVQENNLTNFSQRFPGAQKLYLSTNFRSTGKLVKFIREIMPVDNGLASRMESAREEGTDPTFTRFFDDRVEADAILNKVEANKLAITDTAVITRTNRQLYLFENICVSRGIKYKILGKKDFFELPEVVKLLKLAKEYASEFANIQPVQALETLIARHGLLRIYKTSEDPTEASPAENLNDICKLAAKHENIGAFLTHLRKLTHARKSSKGLTLCTAHQSKGHEFKIVYLVGVNEGLMPHSKGELAEEKRIFFVGASRAADELNISFFRQRSMFLNNYTHLIKVHTNGELNVQR